MLAGFQRYFWFAVFFFGVVMFYFVSICLYCFNSGLYGIFVGGRESLLIFYG